MVTFLNKSEGSEDFHQIVDFLNTSHIKFALTKNPTIYTSLIQHFWETASTNTSENGEMEITTTINRRIRTVTEASIRRHLKLEDSDGINTLPNAKIFEQLAIMGPKKTAWKQFSSNIATAIICLATNRTFKFSKMIFEGMTLQGKGSIILVESHITPTSAPSTSQPPTSTPSIQTTHDLEEPATMPHDLPLPRVQSLGSDEGRRTSADTEILLDQEEPTKLVEDLGSGEKGEKEISTATAPVSTASEIPKVSTAAENLVYIRKTRQEQEKYDLEKALDLQKQLDEKKAVVAKADPAYDIDWNDPAMLRYHALQNRSFSVAKDSEIEKEVIKRPRFDLQQKSIKKSDKIEASGFVQKQSAEEEKEKKNNDSSKPVGGSRKKTLARKRVGEKQSKESTKRQKMEDDTEKEELKAYLDIVPGDEFAMKFESLATKYPIVDWKTHILTKNFMYYQIIRANGSSKNYKIFSKMFDDFDRQDVIDLHKLVEERYVTTSLEGYDLMLWGDLKTLFKPDEEDKVWRNQHGYNLISCRLFDSCGIHILMLSRRLEVDHESEMAFKLLRYLKGQPKLGLWYLKDSPFDLVAYTDSDYAGVSLDRKSTTGGKAKKSVRLMLEKLIGMEFELMLVTQS
ncbi:hypothetical protein Tco_0844622 [Tanacetum coccineum]